MRKFYLPFTLLVTMLITLCGQAQDFSNKGKDFWVGYGYHQVMNTGNQQQMVLYFATDQVTNITISIPGIGYTQNITTPAGNNVVTSATIPKTPGNDARLLTEGQSNLGIHVTSDKPMVAYAHIYNASVSGATILFPTNTLGKEYYSVNYKNWSNSPNSNCWFYVVAADTGITKVEITPTGNTTGGWVAGTTYTVNLTQGQIYNVMGSLISSPNGCNPVCTGYDLTGSLVKSISSGGGGCKKIAVFSGSGRISITCNNSNSSSDNYMVQAMPKSAWGKKYLTVPANGNQSFNFYRVCVSDPTTVVKINGTVTGLPLQGGFYYEIAQTNQPQMIEADKPIMVAQYFTSQGACGNGSPGDPEVIYLSAVEQNINKVLWNATPNFAITTHDFNVVIPNSGTAVSSFKLDGAPIGGFVVHPQDPNYVYLKQNVSAGFHIIQSDSGFNAIAYGFGTTESYGYNAGTNVKDLYQQIGVTTQYGIETTPSVCVGSPFKFKVSLPYIADSIYWNLSGLPAPTPPNVMMNPAPIDSSTVVNGKTIYWYSLPSFYTVNTAGTYPVTIITHAPNADGCGNEQNIDFDLLVSTPPVADFAWTPVGCVAEPVQFTETTPQTPKPTYHFWWNFGDPASGANNTSNIRNPIHLFSAPGVYTVRFSDITTPGCLSDTIQHTITIAALPGATISGTATVCINAPSPDITFTATGGTAPYTFTYTINGGPNQTITTVSGNSVTVSVPTNVAGTFTYNLVSVKNAGSTLCTQPQSGSAVVTVGALPTATISGATTVCFNDPSPNITFTGASGAAPYTFIYTINGGPNQTVTTTSGNSVTVAVPTNVAGTFTYSLVSVQAGGSGTCSQAQTGSAIITVNPMPTATISGAANVCLNAASPNITFTGASGTAPYTFIYTINGGPNQTVTTTSGNSVTVAVPTNVAGTFTYSLVSVQGGSGNLCSQAQTGSTVVTVGGLPTATISGATTVCLNAASPNITFTGASGTAPYTFTYTINGGPNQIVVSVGNSATVLVPTNIAGTFTYTLVSVQEGSASTCSQAQTGSTVVTVNPAPTAAISGAGNVCLNGPSPNITFTGANSTTPYTFTYTINGGPNQTITTVSGNSVTVAVLTNVAGTFTYSLVSVQEGGANLCSQAQTGSTVITVNPLPTATISGTTAVCLNSPPPNITFTGANGTAPFTFTYTINGGSNQTVTTVSGNSVTVAVPTNVVGTFTYSLVSVREGSANTCNQAQTGSAVVTVNLAPTASISGASTVCLNGPSPNVTFTGAAGLPPYTFTYNINGGPNQTVTTVSGNSVTVAVPTNVAGVFTYNLVSVQEGGPSACSQNQTGSTVVTVKALPTATISGATAVCLNGTSPNITFTGAGGTVPYTFTYNINGGPNQTITTVSSNSVTVAVPTNVAGTFTYSLVNVQEGSANACSQAQTGSTVITINALPTATISGTAEVCLNATSPNITFTGAAGIAPYTFIYTINGGPNQTVTTTSGNSVTVAAPTNTAGTFTYSLVNVQEGSANACSQAQTGSTAITVNPLPVGNFNFSAPNCETGTITFTDVSIPNVGLLNGWQWNFGDPGSGAANTSTLQNPIHTFSSAATYNVTLTVTTDKGCISIIKTKQVVINPRPKAGFISPVACAADLIVPFGDTSRVASGSVVAWQWNFGDPNATPPNPNTSTLQNPNHYYTVAGNYTVQQIVTSNNGCKDTITQTFTINGIPSAGFTVQNSSTLCSNQDVSITDGSSINFGSLIRTEIYWDYANNPAIKTIDNTPTAGEIYTHTYPEFGAPFSKTYDVRYVTYSGTNCVNTLTRTITLLATPTLQFDAVPPVCSVVPSFQITQAQLLNGLPGAGVFSGTGTTPTGIFNPTAAGAGIYTIRYTYTGSNNCTNYKEQIIEVYQTPGVNAGPDKVVLEGGVVGLTPAVNASVPITYLWTPATGLNNPTTSFPMASPPFDITYTLKVTTDKGCSATDQVFVKVLKAPAIPNIFSPNGDAVHDKWQIAYLESYPGCTVDVYNRYGQLVYHSIGYSTPWDGKVNGKDVPVGTYYYIVDPKNGRSKMSGYVDVIR